MDEYGSSGRFRPKRVFKEKRDQPLTTASRAVREGYVADVERPPPPGVPSKRASKRIPTTVLVKLGDAWLRTPADISAGGALLLMPNRFEDREVQIRIELADGSGKWEVTGRILRRDARGKRVGHHVQFDSGSQADGLGAAIDRALAAGESRLETR